MESSMTIRILGVATLAACVSMNAHATMVASDNGSNYSGGWTSGSNGGFGFGAWSFSSYGGGYKGAFIGDPANIGVTGMGSSAFALYANGSDTPTMRAYRYFSNSLGVGESFSFDWGVNWTSGFGGSKGIKLMSGNGTEINLYNNGNSDQILLNGQDVGFGYGTNAMTWTFTQTSATTIAVTANDRDGSGSFSTTINVTGVLSGFMLEAQGLGGGGQREPYYNNFTITGVPAPGAMALMGVAGLVAGRRRRA
jgi:MYXO-CTERM domain-containing protein